VSKKIILLVLLFEKWISLINQFGCANFQQSRTDQLFVLVFSIQRLDMMEYFLGQTWYIYYWKNLQIPRYIYFLLLQKYTLTVFICLRCVLCGVLPWLLIVYIIIIIKCLLQISTRLPCWLSQADLKKICFVEFSWQKSDEAGRKFFFFSLHCKSYFYVANKQQTVQFIFRVLMLLQRKNKRYTKVIHVQMTYKNVTKNKNEIFPIRKWDLLLSNSQKKTPSATIYPIRLDSTKQILF
jgi:hypothetical protein